MRKKTLLLHGTISNTQRKGWRGRESLKRLSTVSATDHLISWKNVKELAKADYVKMTLFMELAQ